MEEIAKEGRRWWVCECGCRWIPPTKQIEFHICPECGAEGIPGEVVVTTTLRDLKELWHMRVLSNSLLGTCRKVIEIDGFDELPQEEYLNSLFTMNSNAVSINEDGSYEVTKEGRKKGTTKS